MRAPGIGKRYSGKDAADQALAKENAKPKAELAKVKAAGDSVADESPELAFDNQVKKLGGGKVTHLTSALATSPDDLDVKYLMGTAKTQLAAARQQQKAGQPPG